MGSAARQSAGSNNLASFIPALQKKEKLSSMEAGEKKKTILLYPSPAIGHLISMVELGKRFLSLPNSPFSTITILIAQAPYNTGSTAPYIRRVSSSHPSIHFHQLPSIPISSLQSPSSANHETLAFRLLRLNIPNVLEAINTLSHSFSISAFIFDMFCASSIEAAAHLGIPSYCFYTSGAQVLAIMLYFPFLHTIYTTGFNHLPNTHFVHVPGVVPFPAPDMILPMRDPNDEAYHGFLHVTLNLAKTSGIIVNTFEALEPRALKTIREGSCVPHAPTPPIYCIGPLVATEGGARGMGDGDGDGDGPRDECLAWLDSQPQRSVVFLCFGSLGVFSEAQLKEIAVGLERSGQRFMWVVRSPPPTATEEEEDKSNRFLAPPEPDLDALLPDGFLERTKERGMVVKSWAPQLAVLNHESVGGFVTHCGWNSVLEAVCAGVPMVAWPLYAEQHLNRWFLVEEMKMALALEAEEESGLVRSDELEKRVREVMEMESALSARMMEMKELAAAALKEGGASYAAMEELAQLWK
ncbi:hypothetical protein ACLOJK_041377 [Asimina triloba]